MAVAIGLALLAASSPEAAGTRAPVGVRAARPPARARGQGARPAAARRIRPPATVTARSARAAIIRALGDQPQPGLRAEDLGKVRVIGTYRKGEGKGVANSTGFIAETTVVAAEFISSSHPLGRRVETFAIAPSIGSVSLFPGHPRWRLTLAAASAAAVDRAVADHGPGAFAWPVRVSRSGKSIIFESIDHGGKRDRYTVRLEKTGNRISVERGVLPRQAADRPDGPLDLSAETRARIAEILRSIQNGR